MTEKHYVMVANMQRFRVWAQENINDEVWTYAGARIHTPTKEYRAVTALHHLRGAHLSPHTIHWTDGWYMGLTQRSADQIEQYVEMCLAAGPGK